ncbi:MAG: hypothetical protein HC896_16175 [Bacteroidales bacterium]|nr:hypothetical protein [Bacteroidales bacterium]
MFFVFIACAGFSQADLPGYPGKPRQLGSIEENRAKAGTNTMQVFRKGGFGFSYSDFQLARKEKFDHKGRTVEATHYRNNVAVSFVTTVYDKNLISTEEELLPDGSVAYKWEYLYRNRQLTQLKVYEFGRLTALFEYGFADTLCIETKMKNGAKEYVNQYVFDKDVLQSKKVFNPPDSLYFEVIYSNIGQKITSETYFSAGRDILYTIEYKYDDQGNVTEVLNYNASGHIISKQVYSYNSEGLLQNMIEYSRDGQVEIAERYEYGRF